MLELKNIVKDYKMADTVVHALQDVSIRFRENEFVSILGHSGCGKTTLLNIIGGLDHYTSGDLIINGKSTKTFKDRDWDSYRNHSIGFVFQSYNLIPHQTVLANVELALTLSGVSKSERRKRAVEALEKVGLGDQLNKKPNQMSGGQMQRVAIARALVNNPDILLADEPTGALDTATSVQIMDILKEVAKDKLVIMVTHNPELAESYSSRIIRLSDGKIMDDTNPLDDNAEGQIDTTVKKKPSMSLLTALSLSLNNLMTKKGRTFLTAFAGSIGIIGIALILSLSAGIHDYIEKVQEDTLASYPIQIQAQTMDTGSLLEAMSGVRKEEAAKEHKPDRVYSNDLMTQMVNTFMSEIQTNNLSAFKDHLESENNEIAKLSSNIRYVYNVSMNIFAKDTENGVNQVNPNMVMADMMNYMGMGMDGDSMSSMRNMMGSGAYRYDSWTELIENQNMLNNQYILVNGSWPKDKNEVILIINERNEVSDLVLYSLGLRDKSKLKDIMTSLMKHEEIENDAVDFSFEDIMKLKFQLVIPTDYYVMDEDLGHYVNKSSDEEFMKQLIDDGMELSIVGIAKPNPDAATMGSVGSTGGIGYTAALTRYVIEKINESAIVKDQMGNTKTDMLSGLPFDDGTDKELTDAEKAEAIVQYFNGLNQSEKAAIYKKIASTPTEEDMKRLLEDFKQQYSSQEAQMELLKAAFAETYGQEVDMEVINQYMASMTEEEIQETIDKMIQGLVAQKFQQQMDAVNGQLPDAELATMLDEYVPTRDEKTLVGYYKNYMPAKYSSMTYAEVIEKIGIPSLKEPEAIYIYANTFDGKEKIADLIKDYNDKMDADEHPENVINYTDVVGIMMSSVSTIVDIISYVLIAFVSISLVVSSIMIGIITYISVLERTKEIGILRAIGASKRDVSHVFNAEAIIIGFTAGIIGIGVTMLLNIPINMIIYSLTDINGIAALPWAGALILVLISMFLTFVAGMFPSRIAAKKDPVEALRSE